MVTPTYIKNLTHYMHSLPAFNKVLPEFSEIVNRPQNIVDKAFHATIQNQITDLKHVKAITSQISEDSLNLTPRELARLKFALTHKAPNCLRYTKWGTKEMHESIYQKVESQLQHMNVIELLSTMYGFKRITTEDLYEKAFSKLQKEIKEEDDLGLISIAQYVVANSAINDRFMPLNRYKYKTFDRNLEFLEGIQEKICERLQEFSNDQIGAICSGIGNSNIQLQKRVSLYETMELIEKDVLNRRLAHMTQENLADVIKAFTSLNLGSDELISGLVQQFEKKIDQTEADVVLDFAYQWSQRDLIPENLQEAFNRKLKASLEELRPIFLTRLAYYLVSAQVKDEQLLSKIVNQVSQGRPLSFNQYHRFLWLTNYINTYFPNLVTNDYLQKVKYKGHLYSAQVRLYMNPVYESEEWQTFSQILQQDCGLEGAQKFVFKNDYHLDFAFMPQKIGIYLAQPHFHLLGRYEEDFRIIKDPPRQFRPSRAFYLQGDYMKMFGWKIVNINYVDIMENVESSEHRIYLLYNELNNLGVEKSENPSFIEIAGNN